jgi:prevent-host-death family protein
MREVEIEQLKSATSALIDEVEGGAVLTVTRCGEPVAYITPIGMSPGIARVVATGRLQWSGRKPVLPVAVDPTGDGPTAAQSVIGDRGPR